MKSTLPKHKIIRITWSAARIPQGQFQNPGQPQKVEEELAFK